MAPALRQHHRSIQHAKILGQVLAPSGPTQLRGLRVFVIAEGTRTIAGIICGSKLRQLFRIFDLRHRACSHHGTAWFHLWVLGGPGVFHNVLCRSVGRRGCAACCVPDIHRSWRVAGWMDLQRVGVYVGVWVLVLGATETSVSQGVVYSGLSDRLKNAVGRNSWVRRKHGRFNQTHLNP